MVSVRAVMLSSDMKGSQMKLSVVIPVYNEARTLIQIVEAVRAVDIDNRYRQGDYPC